MMSTAELQRLKIGFKEWWERLRKSRVVRNWSYLAGSNLMVQAISLLSSIRIARTLAPAGYGTYNILFVQVTLFGIFAALGLRQIVIRTVAREPERSRAVFYVSSIMRAGSTILAVAGILVYNALTADRLTSLFLFLAVVNIASNGMWDLVESIAFGEERMELSATVNLISGVVWVAMIYALPVAWFTLMSVASLTVGLQAVKSIVFFIIGLRQGYMRGSVDWQRAPELGKRLFVESLPYLWLALFTTASSQVPVLFLMSHSGAEQVAFFNIGYKLLNPMQMTMMMALTALFPSLSRIAVNDHERFVSVVRTAFLVITIVGIGFSFLFSLFRTEAVGILYGKAYLTSADVIAYQCWYTVLYALFCLIGTILSSLDKQNALSVLSTIYTAIAVTGQWIGSSHGALGLSLTYVIVGFVNMTYHWAYMQRVMPVRLSWRFTSGIFVALVCALAVSLAIPQDLKISIRFIVLIVIGGLTTAAAYRIASRRLAYNHTNGTAV